MGVSPTGRRFGRKPRSFRTWPRSSSRSDDGLEQLREWRSGDPPQCSRQGPRPTGEQKVVAKPWALVDWPRAIFTVQKRLHLIISKEMCPIGKISRRYNPVRIRFSFSSPRFSSPRFVRASKIPFLKQPLDVDGRSRRRDAPRRGEEDQGG